MKYDKPRITSLCPSISLGCCVGSNPSYTTEVCQTGTKPTSQGGGCNPGCVAANHCNPGGSAGFQGQPQGCQEGVAAVGPCAIGHVASGHTDCSNGGNPTVGCAAGNAVGSVPSGGGCMSGGSPTGCLSGSGGI